MEVYIMKKPTPYYYLLVREDGYWDFQFSDYDKELVKAEREDMLGSYTPNGDAYRHSDFIIFTTKLPDTPEYNGVCSGMAMDKCNQLNLREDTPYKFKVLGKDKYL